MSKYLLIGVVFLSSIVILYNAKVIFTNNIIISELETNCKDKDFRIQQLIYIDSLRVLNDYIKLDELVVFEDKYGDISNLKNIFNSNKIMLKYSDLSCRFCVENELKILSNYKETIGIQNIIIVTTYEDKGLLYRFIRINKLEEYKIFNLKRGAIIENLDNMNKVYYAVIGNDFMIKSLFIPEKTNNEATEDYFGLMKIKYFK